MKCGLAVKIHGDTSLSSVKLMTPSFFQGGHLSSQQHTSSRQLGLCRHRIKKKRHLRHKGPRTPHPRSTPKRAFVRDVVWLDVKVKVLPYSGTIHSMKAIGRWVAKSKCFTAPRASLSNPIPRYNFFFFWSFTVFGRPPDSAPSFVRALREKKICNLTANRSLAYLVFLLPT